MTIPPKTSYPPTDTLSRAGGNDKFKVNNVPGTSKPTLDQKKVDEIRQAADAIRTGSAGQPNRSGVQVVVVYLVSRFGMIPMMLFVVMPQKAMEVLSPVFAETGKQFMLLAGNAMTLITKVTETVVQAFTPMKNFVKTVHEAVTQAFNASVEVYKSIQTSIQNVVAKIKIPFGEGLSPLFSNLKKWIPNTTNLSGLYRNLSEYVKNAFTLPTESFSKESNNLLSHAVKIARRLNAALERHLESLKHKAESKLKQVKENVVDPIVHFAAAVVKELQDVASAMLARVQTIVNPAINLAANMSMAAKAIAEGSLKNVVQFAQSLANQVQNAAQIVARAAMQLYEQVILQNMILPLMASLQAGWSRLSAMNQKFKSYTAARMNEILSRIREYVRRLASHLEALFGAIQGWAQRKWKQKWQPALKEVPKMLKKAAVLFYQYSISFFWALLAGLIQLFWLLGEIGRNIVNLFREAFSEVAAQRNNWK